MSRRYRQGGPMYWWWGLLVFRYPGAVIVLFFTAWLLAKCAGY